MIPSRMDRLWADYGEHHQQPGNKYCHMIGIPLIIVGLLGLLSVPLFRVGTLVVDWALIYIVVIGAVDLFLDAKLSAAMFLVNLVLWLVAGKLGWHSALGLFVLGWILQLVGHGACEKRSAAFYKNLAHLVVGPLWVLNHFVHLRSEPNASPAPVGS